MSKQRIIHTFIHIVVGVLLVIPIAFGAIKEYGVNRKLAEYKASLAEHYGTDKTVYVRENTRSEPLWLGEPKGAYLYTGYVGYGMSETDKENIVILDTGDAAMEALGIIEDYNNLCSSYGILLFIAASAFVINIILAACVVSDIKKNESWHGSDIWLSRSFDD